jgi:hypothetical protein
MSALLLVGQVAHWAALLPLIVCVVLALRRQLAAPEAVLLACAFAVSFIAEQGGRALALQGINNWWISYVAYPIQFGLFAALLTDRPVRSVAVAAVFLMAVVSALRGTLGAPETLVQVCGGALVGFFALEHKRLAPYRAALLTYCIATIPFLLVLGFLQPNASGFWIVSWLAYQAIRVFALLMVGRALFVTESQREVPDGPGDASTSVQQRGANRAGAAALGIAPVPAPRRSRGSQEAARPGAGG